MKDQDYCHDNNNLLDILHEEFFESNTVMQLMSRMTKIAESRDEKANLENVVSKCTHLSVDERNQSYHVLKAHEGLFDGTLG